ncbi:MAG TPA: sigma-54 dependent transcriptional regulator [Burkholderiaceae bacterium]|nr:sigma-54 dependent transcriptional regulator [Burkholderiaceae bacterium]
MDERRLLCVRTKYSDCAWIEQLEAEGWGVEVAGNLIAAHRQLQERPYLAGLIVPGGIDAVACAEFDAFLRTHGGLEWVGAFEPAVLALPACRDLIVDHLFDHHTIPVNPAKLASTLGHAHGHAALRQASRAAQVLTPAPDTSIVGNSAAARQLLRQIMRVAKVDAPVLVCGESGSGKELTAQAIHRHSSRANGPFVPVNCGAIQATLIQSELFGHEKGAFTGASKEGRGLIEAANGGTIFLDEIGDLSLELQINLLRFLQEKTINRVGSTRSIRVDARVIAATHVDLEKAVATGTFREDLFYRLNVVPLRVPALRERLTDVGPLAEHFFQQFVAEKGPQLKGFSRRAMVALGEHQWPGNVRELINRVRRAMVMAEGRLIGPADLGFVERDESRAWDALEEARTRAERGAISVSLQQAGRNVTEAARQLGVSRMTLYRLMAKHGIDHDLRN